MSTTEDIKKTLLRKNSDARAVIRSQRELIKRNLAALRAIQVALDEPITRLRRSSLQTADLEQKFKSWVDGNPTLEFTAMNALAALPEANIQKVRWTISRCILRGEVEVCGERSTGPWRPAKVYRKKVARVAEGEFGRY